jgi:hypothetical protein
MSSPSSSAFGANNLTARTDLANIVARVIRESRPPTVDDRNYPIGQFWVDEPNLAAYVLCGVLSGEARWKLAAVNPLDAETFTGNSGGAVGPDGNLNVNVVAAVTSGFSVDGNPSTNTLTINSLSPFYQGQISTVGNATQTVLLIPVPPSRSIVIEARVVGYEAADGVGGLLSVTAHRNGAGPVIVGTSDLFKDVPAGLLGATFSADASGSDVRIRVTGTSVGGKTIYWSCQAETTVIGAF